MMKRGLLFLAVLLMGVGGVWAQRFSVANGDGKLICYNVTDAVLHAVEVVPSTEAGGYSGAIVIPASVVYEGVRYGVTGIGADAFAGCMAGLTSVELPSSIVEIGSGAFKLCSGLGEMVIPNSVGVIGAYAFQQCGGLRSVTMGSGVTEIGMFAFNDCGALVDMVLPNSVTEIGQSAFMDCVGLRSVVLPVGLTKIESAVFNGCSGLETIVIPSTVTEIGMTAFQFCVGLESVVLPGGLTKLGNYAFFGCSGLRTVVLPSGLTRLGKSVFEECSGLESVVMGEGLTEIGRYAFSGCSGLVEMVVPDGVRVIGEYAFHNCMGLRSLTIGAGVDSIGVYAFANDIGLRRVYWNATEVRDFECVNGDGWEMHPFAGSPVGKVVFGDGVVAVPGHLFSDFVSIDTLVFGGSVEGIGEEAFWGCSGVSVMVVGADVPPTIGVGAFYGVDLDVPVYVPCGALDRYLSDEGWSRFTNIRCDGDVGNDVVGGNDEVRVYPNPSCGAIWVASEGLEWIEVVDMRGVMVERFVGVDMVDLSDLERGVYVLRMLVKGDVVVRRVVLE